MQSRRTIPLRLFVAATALVFAGSTAACSKADSTGDSKPTYASSLHAPDQGYVNGSTMYGDPAAAPLTASSLSLFSNAVVHPQQSDNATVHVRGHKDAKAPGGSYVEVDAKSFCGWIKDHPKSLQEAGAKKEAKAGTPARVVYFDNPNQKFTKC